MLTVDKNPPTDLTLDIENKRVLTDFGVNMRKKLDSYIMERRETEKQWLKNLYQFLGKYDPEIQNSIPKDRSAAYPRVTRVKVISLVSRLMSLLFPMGERNWGFSTSGLPSLDTQGLQAAFDMWVAAHPEEPITPENVDTVIREYAEAKAKDVENLLADQLDQIGGGGTSDYVTMVRRVVLSSVVYSLGVLRGPMTVSSTASEPVQNVDGTWTVQSKKQYIPYFEFVNVWDYYPDMSAKTFDRMEGQFQRHLMTRYQVRQLAERDDFLKKAVLDYLALHESGNWKKREFETELQALSHKNNVNEAGRKYELFEWTGFVTGKDLRAAGEDVTEEKLDDQFVASVWLIDSTVIRAKKLPFDAGFKHYHQFVFEEDEVNLVGSGLPPIMRDSQLSIGLAARMILDNAALVAGPQVEVDESLLDPGQDRNIAAYKVWRKMAGYGAAGNNQRAVLPVSMESHIPELISVFDLFMNMADRETFIGQATGGEFENVPSEAMRTTSGASMLMGATALPFRDIVRNFDAFTVSVISSLYAWNRMFNADATHGDMQPIALGATSLLAKEVRSASLDNLVQTLHPQEEVFVNWEGLFKNRVQARDLLASDVMASQSEITNRKQAAEQANSAAQDLNTRLQEATIKDTLASAFKDMAQGRTTMDKGQVAQFAAILSALEKGADPSAVASYLDSNVAGASAGAETAGVPAQQPQLQPTESVGGTGFAPA